MALLQTCIKNIVIQYRFVYLKLYSVFLSYIHINTIYLFLYSKYEYVYLTHDTFV